MKRFYTLFLGLILIGSVANSQTIFAIQNTTAPNGDSPQMGNIVTTTGTVTAVVLNGSAAGTFFIQDGPGAWNGLYIYESGTVVSIGDNVSVTGTVLEFNNTTELGSVTNITITSSGNPLPAATVLSTTNVNQEDYEGVLVQVQSAPATAVGSTLGFGLWEVNDGSGGVQIDDDIFPYANNAILNNTYSVTGPVQYSFGTFKILPRDINDVGGAVLPNFVSIYDIQFTTAPSGDSPENGNIVMTKGVVTGIIVNGAPGTFFIQDGNGAWNGLYIFESGTTVARGDSVEVTGTITEFNGTTEMISVSSITVLNSGNTLPTPFVITTGNANAEDWEGVLIRVMNAPCTSNSGGFGLWDLNDGSGVILADDDIFPYAITAVVSTSYNVTGIGHYSFSAFKILPRDANDIALATSIDKLKNTTISVYPNPVKNRINFELDVNAFIVKIIDITGKTVTTHTSINGKLTISTSNFNNGIYFYSIIDNSGNVIATNKFIVAK